MVDPGDQRVLLDLARADLLDGGHGDLALRGVPSHVAASWRRCAEGGVTPHGVESEYHPELDFGSRLARCARPVIDALAEQIADIPACVALTDGQARILSRTDSSSWIGAMLDRVYFARGFGYAEDAVGTNGVGTVLEFGESVHIVGAEHFTDSLQSFACAGAPIRDPLTGRIEGVLDISCLSRHSTPIMHSLVRAAALQIERTLLLDRNQVQQALFDGYLRVDGRSRDAVLAVGHRVVMANSAMQTLLDPSDQEVLHEHVRYVMSRRDAVDDRIDLPSGTQVRVRGSVVRLGQDVAGMVAVVSVLHEVDRPAVRPVPDAGGLSSGRPAPVVTGSGPAAELRESSSPAWRAAAATAESALRRGDSLLVLGESGTGRCTLLADLFRLVHPTGRVVAHDARAVEAAPAETAARLRQGTRADPVLQVLRDVDRLSPAAVTALVAALGGGSDGVVIAATAVDPDPSSSLLTLFHASVTVPPLRNRGADLAGLAHAMLNALAPHRDVRLSSEALRLLGRHDWPGNLPELHAAMAAALARRPVGVIEARDLPACCQSSPRGALRAVDEVERDAIVGALRDADGNRVAAAAALGLARSTLYRKIRQYGITV